MIATPSVPTPPSSTPPVPAPPAMAPAAFRRLAHAAVDLIADHLDGIAAGPVFTPMASTERAALLERSLPDTGLAPEALLALVGRDIFTRPMGRRISSAWLP